MIAAGLSLLAAGPSLSAQELLARVEPRSEAPRFMPGGDDLRHEDPLPVDETLSVAGDMYSLWAAQLAVLISADESPRAWQQFMGLGPTLAQAYKQLGLAAWERGELVEASRLLAKAHALDPKDAEVTRKLGYAYKQTGQYELGLDLLFLASIDSPEEYLVWLWLGDAQRLLGQYDEAYESMLMARDLGPAEQAEELQSFVDYTLRLGEKTPSWESFETHRDFAERHLNSGRIRLYIAEFLRALSVAPEQGVTEADGLQRKAYTYQQIGIQYTFLKEHDVAIDYYLRAADLYRQAGSALDTARNLNNIADAYAFLADREWLDTADLRHLGRQYRYDALKGAQDSGDAQYVRYVQGRLLTDLLKIHPHTSAEVQEVRNRNLRELPKSGPIPDFSLAAVADGEIAFRLTEEDYAGARIMVEMVLPYYEQSEYLEDSERTAFHYVNLAHIYQAQEHYQEAERQAQKAVDLLSSIRDLMTPDAFNRSSVLDTYRQAATALARAALALDKPEDALAHFERYQYRSREDMLGSAIGGDAILNEYSTEKELIEQRLPLLQEELDAALAAGDESSTKRLELRVAADTQRLNWLRRDITFLGADKVHLSLPQPGEAQDFLGALPDDVTLAGYLTDDFGSVALVVSGKAVRGFLLPEATEQTLNQYAGAFGANQEAAASAEALSALAGLLVTPIQEALTTEILYIVTNNVLNNVPFEALPVEAGALVDQHAIAYVQSGNHLLVSLSQDRAEGTSAIVFAPDGAAPSALRAIAALPDAELLSGESATESRFRSVDTNSRWVHVAAPADMHHPDVMLNGFILTADDSHDGVVHAAELLTDEVPVSLVSLDLDYGQSLEGTSGMRLSGLVDGLYHAGASSVVLNLWTAQDAPTAFFFKALYANLSTMDKLAAFHAAQLATRVQFPETAQWAAFTFRGNHR